MLINCQEASERREGQSCLRCQPSFPAVPAHPDNNTNLLPATSHHNITNSQLLYFIKNISKDLVM